MDQANKQVRDPDDGFTLIELLVVILIIAILAGIAIPVFLNQRKKAYDASAKSDLRDLAQFEEAYLANHPTYGTLADLIADGSVPRASPGDSVTILYASDQGYCLTSQNVRSANRWYYDSQAGGLQPAGSTGCPVTISGTSGGTFSG